MAPTRTQILVSLITILQVVLPLVQGWNQQERVLLRDIQVITLHADRYTNARRTSPVPQLKCIGGSAGCNAVMPQVVQCHNRGWDGIDVQWECKVDMDNAYRFGKVEVNCEGFEYPEDPYVLRGSCGLEYTLELTEQGRRKTQDGHSYSGFGSGFFGSGQSKGWNSNTSSSDASGIIVFIVILGIAYGVYKLFLSGPSMEQPQHPQPDQYGFQSHTQPNAPPPPGFKSDFTGSQAGFGGFAGNSAFGGQANQGPGFWTGLGTGGVLGYLFGNRRSQPCQSPYYNTWGGPSFSGQMYGNPPPYRPPESSGARTASGFGGTKRR